MHILSIHNYLLSVYYVEGTVLGIGAATKMSRRAIHCLMREKDLQTNTIFDPQLGIRVCRGLTGYTHIFECWGGWCPSPPHYSRVNCNYNWN